MEDDGCIKLLASSPSFVNMIKPEVLMSNLPTETHLPDFISGNLLNMVGLPSGSFLVEISPIFLLYIKTRVSVLALQEYGKSLPSSLKRSFSETN